MFKLFTTKEKETKQKLNLQEKNVSDEIAEDGLEEVKAGLNLKSLTQYKAEALEKTKSEV